MARQRYRQQPPPGGGPDLSQIEDIAREQGIDLSGLLGGAGGRGQDIYFGDIQPGDRAQTGRRPPSPIIPGGGTRREAGPPPPIIPGGGTRGERDRALEAAGPLADLWRIAGINPDLVGGIASTMPPGTQAGGVIDDDVANLLQRFYEMERNELIAQQALLYAGGFYGNVDLTDVRWGEHDDISFAAWAGLIGRTARLNAAGQEISYSQVLMNSAEAAGIELDALSDAVDRAKMGDDSLLRSLLLGTETQEGRVINIMLSDPNGLRQTIDQSASAVLGRKATPEEQRAFISMIHNVQREGQMAMQTAEPGTRPAGFDSASLLGFGDEIPVPTDPTMGDAGMMGEGGMMAAEGPGGAGGVGMAGGVTGPLPGDVVTEYAAPDEAATAEALLREQNPAEAGAHDIAIQYANFIDMLGGMVDFPRVTA